MSPFVSGDEVRLEAALPVFGHSKCILSMIIQALLPFVSYAVQYPLMLAMFFLTCFADPKPTLINIDGRITVCV